jgi:hypothetical protein
MSPCLWRKQVLLRHAQGDQRTEAEMRIGLSRRAAEDAMVYCYCTGRGTWETESTRSQNAQAEAAAEGSHDICVV